MVGVPGRSKGCSTCRRRKKGCDKQAPICGQCRLAGLVCGGYERERVWLHATQDPTTANATYTKSSRANSREQALSPQLVSSRSSSDSGRDSRSRSRSSSRSNSTDITLHDSLARTARTDKYLGLYWSTYLPNGRPFSLAASRLTSGGWINDLGKLYESEATLRYAVLALSASMVAAQNSDAQLQLKGLQTYTKAIQEMSCALHDPQRRTSNGLIAAVRHMGFYEILFGPEGDQYEQMARSSQIVGWQGHSDGEIALTLQRGPAKLADGTGHQMFVDGRANMLIGAVLRRERCPLSDKAWKAGPWQTQPKSLKDQLTDVFVEIPGLLEDLDSMRTCDDPLIKEPARLQLLHQCNENEAALERWKQDMGTRLDVYDYTVADTPLPSPLTDEDFALLHICSIYWVVCVLLYSTQAFAASTPDRPIDPNAKVHTYVHRIAHSIHLFFLPSGGTYSAHSALFPLGIALRFLIMTEPVYQLSRERQMLVDCFSRPFMGTYVGRFLDGLQQDVPQVGMRKLPGMEGRQFRARWWWYEGNRRPVETGTLGSSSVAVATSQS